MDFFLVSQPAGCVNRRGIQKAGSKINDIRRETDVDQSFQRMYAVEGAKGEEDRVQQLADHGGAVVPNPKSSARVAEKLCGVFPDDVVHEYIKNLHDAVDRDADQH